jgi:capsular polysaccharide biosynthesis protein
MEEERNVEPIEENEIDLMELIRVVLRKWYIIAASVGVVMVLVGIYAYGIMPDTYTAETSVLVQVQSDDTSDEFDFQQGERLVATYTEIATSNRVLDELQNEMESDLGVEYSKNKIRNMIEVNGVQNTVVIKLSVESSDKIEAVYMANTIVDIMKSTSQEYAGLDNIELLDVATIPEQPSGPNRILYMAIAFILGGMIGGFWVLGIEFLDKTIKTTKDMENKLGLRVLGGIPEYNLESEVEE